MGWLKQWRRRRILKQPFPPQWKTILEVKVPPFLALEPEKQLQLQQLVQLFLHEKNFEGCAGLKVTDEMKVTIAGHACLLLLGLRHDYYQRLSSVLVYPSTVLAPTTQVSLAGQSPVVTLGKVPISGQAFGHGSVLLVWNTVRQDTSHPQSGHNVVYHEFAHILDMYDGVADGTPPLAQKEQYQQWATVCSEAFAQLKARLQKHRKTFLNPYAITNEAEFFAVATEYFFERPVKMKRVRGPLYQVLCEFYGQDPAQRVQAAGSQA